MAPLGIRNNNPGNIRPGVGYQGENGTNGGFATFDTPQNGIRAIFVLLRVYQQQHDLETVTGMIGRWAPPDDNNDTPAYVAHVASAMGIGADTPFDITDKRLGPSMVAAIILHENGENPYAAAVIGQAQVAAYG